MSEDKGFNKECLREIARALKIQHANGDLIHDVEILVNTECEHPIILDRMHKRNNEQAKIKEKQELIDSLKEAVSTSLPPKQNQLPHGCALPITIVCIGQDIDRVARIFPEHFLSGRQAV